MGESLHVTPPIKTAPLISGVSFRRVADSGCPAHPPQGGREARGFMGARLQPRKVPSAVSAAPATRVSNITNNLRLLNQITVRVSLYGSRRESVAPRAIDRIGMVRHAAQDAVNAALLRAVDRELALMARGENIASNQRRRSALGRYLTVGEPARVLSHFYAARMQPLVPGGGGASAGAGPSEFYGDIVTERRSYAEKSCREERVVRVVETGDAPEHTAREAGKLADQVLEKLARRMRIERGRRGIL